jgi:hypothetical protein
LQVEYLQVNRQRLFELQIHHFVFVRRIDVVLIWHTAQED